MKDMVASIAYLVGAIACTVIAIVTVERNPVVGLICWAVGVFLLTCSKSHIPDDE